MPPWVPNEFTEDGSLSWRDDVMKHKTPEEMDELRRKVFNKKTVWNPVAAALTKAENGFNQRVVTPQKQKEKRRATKPKFGAREWLQEIIEEEME